MPFYNRPAELEVSGDIEILGPDLADINGGMGGIYVRSIGKKERDLLRSLCLITAYLQLWILLSLKLV